MIIPLSWRDGVEILFFSGLFYYLALWLRHDKHTNLVWYFYGYCTTICIAYFAELSSITLFLLICSPIVIMLFITVHQETLQRNFVALKSIQPTHHLAHNWLEPFIQGCLHALHKNKSITCLIERTDQLDNLVHTACVLNAPVQSILLETIIASSAYDEQSMIWINKHGHIQGINSTWHKQPNHANWLDCACIYTTKVDALVVHGEPISRTFTLIMNGNPIEHMSAHQLQQLLQKYISFTNIKETSYGITPQNYSEQERTP